jgi:protocatechuate 3,4-dioxygenase beta subunit
MRHFPPANDSVRRLVFAGISSSLAIGLIAALMPASQAAPTAIAAPARPAALAGASSAQPSRTALERAAILAAAMRRGEPGSEATRILAAITGHPSPASLAALPSAGASGTKARTSVITGRVHAGGSAGQVCVTATSGGLTTTARVQPTGRYLLSVRPGRYTMGLGHCTSQRGIKAGLSGVLWTDQGGSVTAQAGQAQTLPAATWWHVSSADFNAPSQAAAQPAAATTGSLSGLVTGAGRPLANICVLAFSERNGHEHVGRTAKNGTYLVRHLRPGRYLVMFLTGLKQCPSTGNWLPQWYPGISSLRKFNKIKVLRIKAGKDTSGIDAQLKRGAEITGTVSNTSGKAIAGVCVTSPSPAFTDFASPEVSTGANGRYQMHSLFPGKYKILFTINCGAKGNYGYQWWEGATTERAAGVIKLTGGQVKENINVRLKPGAMVAGTVVAKSPVGKPVAGVCVTAFAADGNPYSGSGPTSATGTFLLRGLAAGAYRLAFDPTCTPDGRSNYLFANSTVTLKSGQDDRGLTVTLNLGGGISGLVTDSHGHPVSGACVRVRDNNGDVAMTGPNGTYRLAGVPTGSHLVEFSGGCGNTGSLAPQFYPNQPYRQSAQPIDFQPNTITPAIDAELQPGGTLTGHVTDTSGHPVARACVVAIGGGFAADSLAVGRTMVTNGRYELTNLAPGTYGLGFGCGHYGDQYYRAQASPLTATNVAVPAGQVTRIGARLSRAATITGVVTNAAGKPLTNVCVTADLAGSHSDHVFDIYLSGFADRTGKYRITGLQPGRYLIQFSDCDGINGGHAQQWYPGQLTVAKAHAVAVKQGQTVTGINATLTAGGSIAGMITNPSHRPVRGVCVIAEDQAEDSEALTFTGKSGDFTLKNLSAGRYAISAQLCASSSNLAGMQRTGLVTVVPGRTTGHINVQLPAGGSVSGQLLGGATGTTPERGVCVIALPVNSRDLANGGYTGVHGNYLIGGLKPGRYRAYFGDELCNDFSDPADPFAPEWYQSQPGPATAKTFVVTAGKTTTGISDVLHSLGGITGSVSTGASSPVGSECVTAVPVGDATDPYFETPIAPELAVSDHAGGYTLPDLIPGRYQVQFSSGCGAKGFATQWWHNAKSQMSATVVPVKFATITGINATLTH